MVSLEFSFNLGFKLGALSRQIELVIETANKDRSDKIKIKAYRVHESLKYILDELIELGIAERVQKDIKSYLNQLSGINMDEEEEQAEEKQEEEQRVLGRIKRKLTDRKPNLGRDLKENETRELDVKLKLWKERIAVDFSKKPRET